MAEAFRTDISFLVAAPLATDLPPASGPIPEVLQRLDVDSDHGLLREACRDAVWGVRAKFAIATGDELQLCTVGGSKIIHFSGHEHVFFEDNDRLGVASRLTTPDLRRRLDILDSDRSTVRLVVVCACHSAQVAKAFLDAGVPHVIAVDQNDTIRDQAAVTFSSMLYKTILQAVSTHRNVGIRDEAHKFQLLPERGDHSEVLFPSEAWPPIARQCLDSVFDRSRKINRCRPPERAMVGRDAVLITAFEELRKPATRVLEVCGPKGAGKTLVTHWIVDYAAKRGRYDLVAEIAPADVPHHCEPWRVVADCLAPGVGSASPTLGAAMRELGSRHSASPALLVVDAVPRDRAGMRRCLRNLLTYLPRLKVIVASRTPLFGDRAGPQSASGDGSSNEGDPDSDDDGADTGLASISLDPWRRHDDYTRERGVLSPREAAEIFFRHLRELRPQLLGVQRPPGGALAFVNALAESAILRATRGHPRTLIVLARKAHTFAGPEEAHAFVLRSLHACHIHLDGEATVAGKGAAGAATPSRMTSAGSQDSGGSSPAVEIPPRGPARVPEPEAAWRLAAPTGRCAVEDVRRLASRVYEDCLGPGVAQDRPLDDSWDAFLASKHVRPVEGRGTQVVVTYDRFVRFWGYFKAWLQLLRRVVEYWAVSDPPLLRFMTRQQAEAEVADAGPFTFSLRFSESQPGMLAITLNYSGTRPSSVLVTPVAAGFVLSTTRYGDRTYRTLADLVNSYQVLQYLPTGHEATALFTNAAMSALARPPEPAWPASPPAMAAAASEAGAATPDQHPAMRRTTTSPGTRWGASADNRRARTMSHAAASSSGWGQPLAFAPVPPPGDDPSLPPGNPGDDMELPPGPPSL